jgi:hypothetical protein
MPTVHFREVQRFSGLVTVAAALALAYGIALQFMPKGWPAGLSLIAAPLALLLVYAVLKLVTEVRDDGLYVRLFPLPFRRIAWDEIESYYVRTYRPIREYGGWGIKQRNRGSGIAYNARGNRGVQLILRSGHRVLIGSQMPESLEAAIANFVLASYVPMEA